MRKLRWKNGIPIGEVSKPRGHGFLPFQNSKKVAMGIEPMKFTQYPSDFLKPTGKMCIFNDALRYLACASEVKGIFCCSGCKLSKVVEDVSVGKKAEVPAVDPVSGPTCQSG